MVSINVGDGVGLLGESNSKKPLNHARVQLLARFRDHSLLAVKQSDKGKGQ